MRYFKCVKCKLQKSETAFAMYIDPLGRTQRRKVCGHCNNLGRANDSWKPTDRDEIEQKLLNWKLAFDIELSEAADEQLNYMVCRYAGLCHSRAK